MAELLTGRAGHVASDSMEYELSSFGNSTFEREIDLNSQHACVLKLKVTLEINAVNISGFHHFRTDYKIYSIDTVGGVRDTDDAKLDTNTGIYLINLIGDDVDVGVDLIHLSCSHG